MLCNQVGMLILILLLLQLILRTCVCVSGGKKCSFFRKFGELCFLETPVLRFALLPYYRRKVEIKEAGEKLLVSLYGEKANNSLNQIRLYKFHQNTTSNNKVVQPEYLCPTSDAAGFHSFRVYYQVQSWKERDNLNPKDWGWNEKKNGNFFPLYTSKDAAPASLLNFIRCGCKADCSKRTCTVVSII